MGKNKNIRALKYQFMADNDSDENNCTKKGKNVRIKSPGWMPGICTQQSHRVHSLINVVVIRYKLKNNTVMLLLYRT